MAPAGFSNVVAVAAGGDRSLALRANGTVVDTVTVAACMGMGIICSQTLFPINTITTRPEGLTNVVAVAAGNCHNLALRADGTVAAWGDNGSGQTTAPAGLSEVVAIAAGGEHSLALRADGTVAAWGNNGYGQVTVPAGAHQRGGGGGG